jgi:hypothetical protein
VGRNAAVAEPVAWGLGASQSSGLRFCPLAGSLARGRVDFTRRASTQAKSSPNRRGVESVKFGCDFPPRSKMPSFSFPLDKGMALQ